MTRVRAAALAVLAATVFAGCGDNPTDPGTTLTLSIISGNNQVATVGMALSAPLTVKLENQDGDPVSGRTVTWALVSAAGPNSSLGATSTTTDAAGTTSVSFTVGDVAGTYQVRASVTGSTVTFESLATQGGVACTPDSEAPLLDLAPGESAVVTGADLACVRLPAHASAASYEVVITPVPDVLAYNSITLQVAGAAPAPPAPSVAGLASVAGSIREPGETSRDLQYELDRSLREMERPLLPVIRAQTVRPSFGLMAVPSVGDQRDFRFSCIDTDSRFTALRDTIRAEVVLVSDKAVIWEDVTSPGAFDGPTYAEIAATFDTVIYATDTTYFGSPGDIDANGRISLLYTPEVNRITNELLGSYSGSFIAGFFCSADLQPAPSAWNAGEMFYLVIPDPTGQYVDDSSSLSEQVVRLNTDNTIAHEFQHMINAQTGSGATDEVWINEGLSHLAEEVVGFRATGFTPGSELGAAELLAPQNQENFFKYFVGNLTNLRIYLQAPQDTAALLNSEDPLEHTNGSARMRGASWSFLRYLLDRFAAPGTEWQKTRQLITNGAVTSSRQAVTNVFGTSFEDLVADWSAMFAIEDRDDLAAAPEAKLTLPSYRLIDLYESSQGAGFMYPLSFLTRGLGANSTVATDLFTATARYVRLTAVGASGATGLRLETPAGDDLPTAWRTRMEIVRTK